MDERVCWVTGASSGIGAAVALELARSGARLVLSARRPDALDEVAEQCERLGAGSVTVHPVDVVDDARVAEVVTAVRSEQGRLDVVVHCAGLVTYGTVLETSAEVFGSVVEVNLLGAANVARHSLHAMRSDGGGTLILVGSLLGHIAVPELGAYVVSKWGLRALARQLKIENADVAGVRVGYVAPGSVDTPIYDRALEDGGRPSRPPPPVMSPERAAAKVVRHIDHRRHGRQTAAVNRALIGAFTLAPAAYDRLVGPAFRRLSRSAPRPDR